MVHSNGSIWFTDPGYGILSDYEGHTDKFELATNVYRLDPDSGEIIVVSDEFCDQTDYVFLLMKSFFILPIPDNRRISLSK